MVKHSWGFSLLSNVATIAMADIVQRVIDASNYGDLYAVLGVAPLPREQDTAADALRRCSVLKGQPLASIRGAFVAMSLACHPDKCKHPKATDAQQAVNKAWEVLKDCSTRAIFDEQFKKMIQRENNRKQIEEMKKQKAAQSVLTERMMQQQKNHSEQKHEPKKNQKSEPTSTKGESAKAKGTEANSKTWDVAGCTLKKIKVAIYVKISPKVSRKFFFKEWQDREVTLKVAEEFAKQSLTVTNQFDCCVKKKNKVDFLQSHDVSCSGKETIAVLLEMLEEA